MRSTNSTISPAINFSEDVLLFFIGIFFTYCLFHLRKPLLIVELSFENKNVTRLEFKMAKRYFESMDIMYDVVVT
jgi:hypothetical protein